MKIGIIGAGAMGGAMARGLLAKNNPELHIAVSNPSLPKLEALANLGAEVSTDNCVTAHDADMIVLAVKPWFVEKVIGELHDEIKGSHKMLVVIAACTTIARINEWTHLDEGERPQVMIVIPNTAMDVAESMTFIVPADATQQWAIDKTEEIFNHMGTSMVIDEAHLPAGTALASCGIAYALRYVRAAVEGGVELGFKAHIGQQIVAQTILGAAKLLFQPETHAEAEIDKVTTPGGITIKGLNEMERSGFTAAVINGLKACVK